MNQDDKPNKKTAKSQFEVYLEYLKKHEVLRLGWVMQRSHMTELNEIWEKMALDLNGCDGPAREISHWKKVFTEWKSHTRRKLKYHRFLSDIEKSLIDITGITEEDCVTRRPRVKKVVELKEERKEFDISEMKNENFRRVLTNDKKGQSKPKAVLILQEGPKTKHHLPKIDDTPVKVKEEKIDHSYDKQPENNITLASTPTSTSTSSSNTSVKASDSKTSNEAEHRKENGVIPNVREPPQNESMLSQSKRAKIDPEHRPKTRDFCVQTPSMGENPFSCRQDGLFYMGNAFITLSRSFNRFCDILEKKLV